VNALSSAERLPAASAGALMRRAALASVGVSTLLVALKTIAYFATGSVSVLAALADSALDLFTASLNLIAIRSALTPADAEHRFGHGKAEPLAGLAQGAFIAGSALFLVIQAIIRLVTPQPIARAGVAVAIMVVSIVCAAGLISFQRHVVAKTGSVAISADRLHYMGDLFTNLGVLLAIALVSFAGWTRADPIIALFVAGFMVASAWAVSRQSYDQLMDRELPDSDRERIKGIVMGHSEVRSLHDLRTRSAGVDTFIQVHIELDPAMSLMRAHEVSDAVESDLCAAFPRAEVIIHQDPAGVEMPATLART
jgi:ferrous-iron efflux pump FieF